MSYWTYINGTVTVSPMGRTQEEKEYILKSVLNHLPIVSGSEDDMHCDIVLKTSGGNGSSSHDEFGEMTNNLTDRYGRRNRNGWLRTYDEYILVVHASLRDREFEQTYKEFIRWLCRLSKRVDVDDILVKVSGYEKFTIIQNEEINRPNVWESKFGQMFEKPTWCRKSEHKSWKLDKKLKAFHDDEDGFSEPNWCEYLMWQGIGNGVDYPRLLGYKYIDDKDSQLPTDKSVGL